MVCRERGAGCSPTPHRASASTLNAVGLLPVSGCGDARVAPPCPTTLWRNLPYLTLPESTGVCRRGFVSRIVTHTRARLVALENPLYLFNIYIKKRTSQAKAGSRTDTSPPLQDFAKAEKKERKQTAQTRDRGGGQGPHLHEQDFGNGTFVIAREKIFFAMHVRRCQTHSELLRSPLGQLSSSTSARKTLRPRPMRTRARVRRPPRPGEP